MGPFQSTSFARARLVGEGRAPWRARCRGPSSRRGSRSTGSVLVLGVLLERRRPRRGRRAGGSCPPPSRAAPRARSTLSSSTRLLPVGEPLGAEERVGHAAADEQRVDARQQALDDLDLVRDLGPAQHGHERPLRRLEGHAEVAQLLLHEQAGHRRRRRGGTRPRSRRGRGARVPKASFTKTVAPRVRDEAARRTRGRSSPPPGGSARSRAAARRRRRSAAGQPLHLGPDAVGRHRHRRAQQLGRAAPPPASG